MEPIILIIMAPMRLRIGTLLHRGGQSVMVDLYFWCDMSAGRRATQHNGAHQFVARVARSSSARGRVQNLFCA